MTLIEKVYGRSTATADGCIEWTGAKNSNGYGLVYDRTVRKMLPVHRVSFEFHRGPIPKDLEIDHLCRNRICVNPNHLEAVPHKVNVYRGMALRVRLRISGRCLRGHAMWGDNLYVSPKGRRVCKTCRRLRRALYGY